MKKNYLDYFYEAQKSTFQDYLEAKNEPKTSNSWERWKSYQNLKDKTKKLWINSSNEIKKENYKKHTWYTSEYWSKNLKAGDETGLGWAVGKKEFLESVEEEIGKFFKITSVVVLKVKNKQGKSDTVRAFKGTVAELVEAVELNPEVQLNKVIGDKKKDGDDYDLDDLDV